MDNKALSKIYLRRAFELQIEGKLLDAEINFKLSLEYNPTSEAHTYLGWIYSLNGNFEKAIEECFSAIEIDREFGNPYNDIGNYLIELGREDEAIEWFRKALSVNRYEPKHYAYYNLGRVYRMQGKWDEALNMFRRAIEFRPDYFLARKAYYKMITLKN
ncbi:MAG: tetratricopeptide repeat protein [Melioribacteraceae bacterium]|nr:tetratricopeptide repeat protein [Melioribacteraceae bacterium]